ncbi:MAG: hypothetical protein FIA95_06360 [Gemmatimonadetes bacterium]|nr:hypothetical protein [Gemmatimonadota bacterium]
MRSKPAKSLWVLLLATGALWGCASTKSASEGTRSDVITREEIMGSGAINLYDVVRRLRPQWINVRAARSFTMETEIVVYQNEMLLGGPDALKQIGPELAYELRWMDGVRAAATLPGLSSGRHIQGAIIVSTKPPGGDR